MNDMAMNGSLTVNEKAYRILRLLGKGRPTGFFACWGKARAGIPISRKAKEIWW